MKIYRDVDGDLWINHSGPTLHRLTQLSTRVPYGAVNQDHGPLTDLTYTEPAAPPNRAGIGVCLGAGGGHEAHLQCVRKSDLGLKCTWEPSLDMAGGYPIVELLAMIDEHVREAHTKTAGPSEVTPSGGELLPS
jgi:predicted small metal-binding protein